MMDKPEYVKNASDKISLYMKYGIYPNDKLLVSYETQKQPLSLSRSSDYYNFILTASFNKNYFWTYCSHGAMSIATENR